MRARAHTHTHTAAPHARVGVSAAPTARPVNVCTGAFYDTASKRTSSLGYVCWLVVKDLNSEWFLRRSGSVR